jgi:hypothetical protein
MADGTKKSLQDSVDNSENLRGENTPSKHLEKYYWKSGVSANPAGRPKGSRNKLAEEFVEDLQTVWREIGISCLRRIGEKQPVKLAQLVAYIMPKEFVVRDTSVKELSDEQV